MQRDAADCRARGATRYGALSLRQVASNARGTFFFSSFFVLCFQLTFINTIINIVTYPESCYVLSFIGGLRIFMQIRIFMSRSKEIEAKYRDLLYALNSTIAVLFLGYRIRFHEHRKIHNHRNITESKILYDNV